MRVIIVCGSRDFHNRVFLEAKLRKLTTKLTCFELVTGACLTGADKMAEDWALKQFPAKKIKLTRFHAEWSVHGRGVDDPDRDNAMLDHGDVLAIFGSREDPRVKRMIKGAQKRGILVKLMLLENV